MGRPKCVVQKIIYTRECSRKLFDCRECSDMVIKGGSCPAINNSNAFVDFTPAEKIAALTAALEELTGMRWVMTDKPKEAADE